ncbi:hypothetical protein ADL06_06505 [Streptomyces sp. NRRL F-6491]|nr:hypothetical protein ADL06_06505 [Streptomyces sp. NRRL F-6491]KOX49674.1 hypothetical protein ADL08_07855 [Streptomyces sp. NRRL F-6492]
MADGLARAGLDQTRLATRAGLGRTTVSGALSPRKPAPSAQTVAAIAEVLRLPVQELLDLRQAAIEKVGPAAAAGPGRPIDAWEPHDLEVHPAGPGGPASGAQGPGRRALPGYVVREHDQVLAEAVRDAAAGRSRIVVLVGGSSTGKTRACWEAVQPLAEQGWLLWHPFDPTRAHAALEDLRRVGPRTVVWLNEAQHYLGDPVLGERIAAAVHQLLLSPESRPVLVLGTLWPPYAQQYALLPGSGEPDPHSRVRELLSGRTLGVSDTFDARALAQATVLADEGDRLLGDALTRARADGRVTQDLAGAPELLNRYQHAGPPAKALLEAAMDARRLGVGLHLPRAFLTDAARDYLTDTDYDRLTDDWSEQAYAEIARDVHGRHAPLRRTAHRPSRRPPAPAVDSAAPPTTDPLYQLADYLEQHGRQTRGDLCPPASFWHSAHVHLTDAGTLHRLARAAQARHRLQWAHHLHHRAARHGSIDALRELARMQSVVEDWQGAEHYARRAAEQGETGTLYQLAELRKRYGDEQEALILLRQAADHGHPAALLDLTASHQNTEDSKGTQAPVQQIADQDDTAALFDLALSQEALGHGEDAEDLAQRAAEHGDTRALFDLARMREKAGNNESAEALLRKAADHGSPRALIDLARMREMAGDKEDAEIHARRAIDRGHFEDLLNHAEGRILVDRLWPNGLDPDGTPTPPWRPLPAW